MDNEDWIYTACFDESFSQGLDLFQSDFEDINTAKEPTFSMDERTSDNMKKHINTASDPEISNGDEEMDNNARIEFLEGTIKSLTTKESYLQNYILQLNDVVNSAKEIIGRRKQYLQDKIEKWYNTTISQLDLHHNNEKDSVDLLLEKLTKTLNKLKNKYKAMTENDIENNFDQYMRNEFSSDVMNAAIVTHNPLCVLVSVYARIESEQLGTAWAARSTGTRDVQPFLINPGPPVSEFSTLEADTTEASSEFSASGLALTGNNTLLVTHVGESTVREFNTAGKLVWNVDILPDEEPSRAVTLNSGHVMVACKHSVHLYDTEGDLAMRLKHKFTSPRGLCLRSNGDVIISDVRNGRGFLLLFDGKSFRRKAFRTGKKDALEAEVDYIALGDSNPWYMTSSPMTDQVLVSDSRNHMVHIHSWDGRHELSIGEPGAINGCFQHPAGVAVDCFGQIVVCDRNNHRLQLFTNEGRWMGNIEGLNFPMDVVSHQQMLYVLEADGTIKQFSYLTSIVQKV